MAPAVLSIASLSLAAMLLGTGFVPDGKRSPADVLRQDRFREGLERYGRGEFDAGLALILGPHPVGSVVREFQNSAGAWIDRAPASGRHQRTLIVAAMSVEIIAASFGGRFNDYEAARGLVEWNCSRLRRFAPVEPERWIHLAVVALLQGARDDSLLAGISSGTSAIYLSGGAEHAKHAGLRFPSEGRFKLAFATAHLPTQQAASWPLTPSYLVRQNAGRFSIESSTERDALAACQKMLRALFGVPGIGLEARLRSGVLSFLTGDRQAAEEDLSRAADSEDGAVRYVANLMLGTIADDAGRPDDAVRRFRTAHEIVPASTSAVALAGRLFRSGEREEAARILAAFEATDVPPDPWNLYSQRDYRFFQAFRYGMRSSLVR